MFEFMDQELIFAYIRIFPYSAGLSHIFHKILCIFEGIKDTIYRNKDLGGLTKILFNFFCKSALTQGGKSIFRRIVSYKSLGKLLNINYTVVSVT